MGPCTDGSHQHWIFDVCSHWLLSDQPVCDGAGSTLSDSWQRGTMHWIGTCAWGGDGACQTGCGNPAGGILLFATLFDFHKRDVCRVASRMAEVESITRFLPPPPLFFVAEDLGLDRTAHIRAGFDGFERRISTLALP